LDLPLAKLLRVHQASFPNTFQGQKYVHPRAIWTCNAPAAQNESGSKLPECASPSKCWTWKVEIDPLWRKYQSKMK